jgi:hypothetical protein
VLRVVAAGVIGQEILRRVLAWKSPPEMVKNRLGARKRLAAPLTTFLPESQGCTLLGFGRVSTPRRMLLNVKEGDICHSFSMAAGFLR